MGLRIAFSHLFYGVFSLCLSTGITDAKITQIASLVLRRGEEAQLTCKQNDNHNYMYWYQQKQGQGLKLISYSTAAENENMEQGDNSDSFHPSRPNTENFNMNISAVQVNHLATYFCASSLDTALHYHLLLLQKPPSGQVAPLISTQT
uniref:Ig-like domain-containing protein n=1 Tax=Crocodylus porosus TaxID=8502 RepID=A0A7M4DXU0_CROPO